jgi:hypothetical protein
MLYFLIIEHLWADSPKRPRSFSSSSTLKFASLSLLTFDPYFCNSGSSLTVLKTGDVGFYCSLDTLSLLCLSTAAFTLLTIMSDARESKVLRGKEFIIGSLLSLCLLNPGAIRCKVLMLSARILINRWVCSSKSSSLRSVSSARAKQSSSSS